MKNGMKRRDFIKKTALATASIPMMNFTLAETKNEVDVEQLSVHIFSKHLQFLDYEQTGAMAKEIGFAGVDLTVRRKGHVLPENVESDLPKAIEAIKKGGSVCEMITTNVESVYREVDVSVLETAAKLGVKYYRSNWFKYPENQSMPKSLKMYQKEIKKLSKLNQKLGIIGCYQNHAGNKVGASFWELYTILETANPDYFGTQYDIRHALAEGTYSWKNGFELLLPHLKTIVLKDFKWEIVDGKWKIVNVPIGEGMVDFDTYFKLLKKHNLNPPVSLHLEYDLGGAQKGKRELTVEKSVVYDAMRKDLEKIQTLWVNA